MATKPSLQIPKQVVEGHAVMASVLESRKMRLNAALTFWNKQDYPQLVSYLLRTNDDSIFVDVFPFLTKRLLDDEKRNQKQITLGACVELLPVLERLLQKKYEAYIVVSLDFIRTMIKRWYIELRDMKKASLNQNLQNSLSLPAVYTKLLSLSEIVRHLSLKRGNVGAKAKVVDEMLSQLT